MDSLFRGQGGRGLVFHFAPFQLNDAKIFLTLFPHLSLSQLDGFLHGSRAQALLACGEMFQESASSDIRSEETAISSRLLLLAGGLFGGLGLFLLLICA